MCAVIRSDCKALLIEQATQMLIIQQFILLQIFKAFLKDIPKYFIVSYRNDLLIVKKLFGEAVSL